MSAILRTRSSPFAALSACSALAAAAGALSLGGCSGNPRVQALSPSDFRAAVVAREADAAADPSQDVPASAAAAARPPRAAGTTGGDARVVTIIPIELDEAGDLATSTGAPAPSAPPRAAMQVQAMPPPAAPTGADRPAPTTSDALPEIVPIDGLVGHINGRPVFASEMLSHLRGFMHAEAAKTTNPTAWTRSVAARIQEMLRLRVENDLMLAEARESLTPEQRRGIHFVLNELRGSVVREHGGGSALLAEQRMQKTLDEAVGEKLDEILLKEELRNKIWPLVQVTYRDVKLRYRRDFEKYNPPSQATFRVIWAPAEPSDTPGTVAERLAAGEAFEAIAAEDFNRYPDDGLVTRSFRGELAAQTLFFNAVAGLNEAARQLEPGQVAGPIEFPDGTVAWVKLESLESPAPISLYEAQLAIEEELRRERWARERQRYIDRIRGKGSYTSEEEMATHLTIIGATQHLEEIRSQ